MSTIGKLISKKIKSQRTLNGLSQSAVAASLSVPLRTYQAWEKDFTSTIENFLKICSFFKIDPEDILSSLYTFPQLLEEHPRDSFTLETNRRERIKIMDYKAEILERALAGESSQEIFHWLQEVHPEEIAEEVEREQFIENCLRDIYHLQGHLLFQKSFPRLPEKEKAVEKRFSLTAGSAVVIQAGRVKQQFLREAILARLGADWIIQWAYEKPGFRLGVSNGFTVSKILDSIPRGGIRNILLFPMNFTNTQVDFPISSTALISSFLYKNIGYNVSTDTLTEEQVFGSMLLADAAILGIGSFAIEGLYERMIRSALGQKAVGEIRKKGIVGDFNYHLLDQEGKELEAPEIVSDIGSSNSKSLVKSVGLEILKDKADRGAKIVIAASGEHKAKTTRIVLAQGYANYLVTDETLADQII